jgi:hypothetical protein
MAGIPLLVELLLALKMPRRALRTIEEIFPEVVK